MIPRYPVKIAASDIVARLRDEGYEVAKRTVERDLVTLSESFPLLSDTKSMPFG